VKNLNGCGQSPSKWDISKARKAVQIGHGPATVIGPSKKQVAESQDNWRSPSELALFARKSAAIASLFPREAFLLRV
jgi:hypothetical protein